MIWPKVSFWPSQYLDEPLATPRRESDLTVCAWASKLCFISSVTRSILIGQWTGCYLERPYEVRYTPIVFGGAPFT